MEEGDGREEKGGERRKGRGVGGEEGQGWERLGKSKRQVSRQREEDISGREMSMC